MGTGFILGSFSDVPFLRSSGGRGGAAPSMNVRKYYHALQSRTDLAAGTVRGMGMRI